MRICEFCGAVVPSQTRCIFCGRILAASSSGSWASPALPPQVSQPAKSAVQELLLSHRIWRISLAFVLISLLFIGSVYAIGVTLLAPHLSLLDGTDVVLGQSIHVHGSSFIPGVVVSLSLDDVTPLYYSNEHALVQTPMSITQASLWLNMQYTQQASAEQRVITTDAKGAFQVTIAVSPNWGVGKHSIRASERFSSRSAAVTFTTYQPGQAPFQLGATREKTTPSKSAISVNPPSLTLGPLSDSSSQSASTQVSLSTTELTPLTWQATWNQSSWLQVDPPSGEIQALHPQVITITVQNNGLVAGNYTQAVTFTSGSSRTTLPVALTVGGCISATPTSLTFTMASAGNGPPAQRILLTNCDNSADWSGSVSTSSGGNWLSVSPVSGTLAEGATQQAVVSVSSQQLASSPGTYTGQIVFTNGLGQVTVAVTFIVQTPTLVVSLASISANRNCRADILQIYYFCSETLSSKNTQADLDWTATSSGPSPIDIQPVSGTISPGQTEVVLIAVPFAVCQVPSPPPITFTFTGPSNAVNVPWRC
ncbi:MAG: hypothetical protein JO202_18205 [Ktedonobacteraceae bacterium]|nr:hypothetical protein [Ktedonobacteraceae bacterium]